MSAVVMHEIYNCPKLGTVKVYIRGLRGPHETIILTVHDLGCSHRQYDQFIQHPAMEQITERCTYVHVEIPGQADNAPDLPGNYVFPTFQEIAEGLSFVMDALSIKTAVLFGEGAGANILARLAMNETHRVFGAILIHCTGSSPGVMESMRDPGSFNISLWQVKATKSNPEKYLLEHRFGIKGKKTSMHSSDFQDNVKSYKNELNTRNPTNLSKFIDAYTNRSNISEKANLLNCPLLLITASLAVQRSAAQSFFTTLQKFARDHPQQRSTVEFVQVENCANPLLEQPEKIAETVQLFIQGLGLVSGALNRRISQTRHISRTHEMSIPESVSVTSSLPPGDYGYEESGPNRVSAPDCSGAESNRKLSSGRRRISMEEADVHKSPNDMVYNPNRKYSSIVMPQTVPE